MLTSKFVVEMRAMSKMGIVIQSLVGTTRPKT